MRISVCVPLLDPMEFDMCSTVGTNESRQNMCGPNLHPPIFATHAHVPLHGPRCMHRGAATVVYEVHSNYYRKKKAAEKHKMLCLAPVHTAYCTVGGICIQWVCCVKACVIV